MCIFFIKCVYDSVIKIYLEDYLEPVTVKFKSSH